MLHALLFATLMLVIGVALRANVGLLRVLYIPASVVAGMIGFGLMQAGLHATPDTIAATATALFDELKTWPGPLIAVVFGGLLLEKSSGATFGDALRRGARSGVLAWIIILGQIAIGLCVYLLLVKPNDRAVHPSFGQLLEVSWAGGHGASTAMGKLYEGFGFSAGRDLALFLATLGLIYGVVSGLVLVNMAVRRGWTARRGIEDKGLGGGTLSDTSAAFDVRVDGEPGHTSVAPTGANHAASAEVKYESRSLNHRTAIAQSIDPLALQVVILAAAFGVGYGLQQLFAAAAQATLADHPNALRALTNLPLFLFTLLGGLIVRHTMSLLRIADLIDAQSIQRLTGVAMELLIVAAVATMRIESIGGYLIPIVALVVLAGAWSAFCLLYLARRLLPQRYWFELGLLNYGFSTANTPQGFMLLRIVDPELKSGAAEDYAVAAPLSAPFVGGGIVTFVAMPLLLQTVGAAPVLGGCTVGVVLLYFVGRALGDASSRETSAADRGAG